MENLIETYLADGLEGKEKADFEAHCNGCPACKDALEDARAFEASAIYALEADRAPQGFEDDLVYSFRNGTIAVYSQSPVLNFFSWAWHNRFMKFASVPISILLLVVIGMTVMPGMQGNEKQESCNMTPGDFGLYTLSKSSVFPRTEIAESKMNDIERNSGYAESSNEENWKESKGDSFDFASDKPLKDAGVYDTMGVGGGAEGLYGAPRGGRKELNKSPTNKDPSSQNVSSPAPGEPLSPERKIIKTGNLTFEVESFEAAYQKIVSILTEERGYIASSSSSKLANGKIRGEIVIRIMPDKFDSITLRLRVLGELKNQQVSSEDVTKFYVDIQARLNNSKVLEERLIKLMTEKKGEIKDLLEVEKELANVRQKIEQLQGEIKYYDNMTFLATIKLDIYEKDMAIPVEYIQTQSANIFMAVSDVEAAYQRAQKIVQDLKGQIVEAKLDNQNKKFSAVIRAYVDADQFAMLLSQFKGLGEVKYANESQTQSGPEIITTNPPPNTPIRKERGLVYLVLNPPQGEYVQIQRAKIHLTSSDVNASYIKAQGIANESQAKVLSGNINKGTNQVVATLTCQVDSEKFKALVESLKILGEVKIATTDEHQTANGIDPKSTLQAPVRKEPGVIELTIDSPETIVAEERGLGATLRNTVKGSLTGLSWSLEMLIVGLITVGPWVILLLLVVFLVKRWAFKEAKTEVKTGKTEPTAQPK
jgi:glycine cleavage system regulatory protein